MGLMQAARVLPSGWRHRPWISLVTRRLNISIYFLNARYPAAALPARSA